MPARAHLGPARLSVVHARICRMPICDYFSAADDQAAVAVLDTLGGPGRAALEVVALKNIDPVVCMAQLEAIMAGCSYEEARQRPRSGQLLSSPEGEGAVVVSVSDTLCELLTVATGDDLTRAAELWSQTQELRMTRADGETVAGVMADLAGLARSARASNRRLYCWWALLLQPSRRCRAPTPRERRAQMKPRCRTSAAYRGTATCAPTADEAVGLGQAPASIE